MRFSIAASVAIIAATAAWQSQAQEVGAVTLIDVFGYETPPGGFRSPIFVQDPIVSNTVLETVEEGRMDVRFLDESQLIVGPGSKVTVDRFVYDPGRGAGEAVVNVGVGVMRFVSGAIAAKDYQIKTPVATMGIRGTDFVVGVGAGGSTAVAVLDGAVEVTSTGGQSAVVEAGFTGVTDGDGVDVSATVGVPALSNVSFGLSGSTSGQSDDEGEEDEEEEGDSPN